MQNFCISDGAKIMGKELQNEINKNVKFKKKEEEKIDTKILTISFFAKLFLCVAYFWMPSVLE